MKQQSFNKEFTSWSDASGNDAVAYIGIEGTYEWNPHFVDFLRSIKVSEPRPNNALQSDGPRPAGPDRR